MEADAMSRLLARLMNGVPKETACAGDPEAEALWDSLETEVAELTAKGLQIDVPGEWPNPTEPVGAAPDAPAEPAA